MEKFKEWLYLLIEEDSEWTKEDTIGAIVSTVISIVTSVIIVLLFSK